MAAITNDFETGTSGTSVSTGNSGGGSDTAFDFVSIGSGAVNAYDNTRSAHGSLSCKLSTPASAVAAYVQWNSTGSLPAGPTWYLRGYFYLTANPAANTRLLNISNSVSGSVASFYVQSTGSPRLTYSSAGTLYVQFTNSFPLNSWTRVEVLVTGDATNGQVAGSLYAGDGTSAIESHTSGALATGAVSSGTNSANIGISTAVASVGPLWLDDAGVSNSGYLGPAVSGPSPGTESVFTAEGLLVGVADARLWL